jgi:DNA-directed RNA polymerase specialized sigma24 family protein
MTQEGFGQAYRQGFVRTVRLLRSRGASADHAEDVAQNAWLQGWRKLNQLRDDGMIEGWVNAIAGDASAKLAMRLLPTSAATSELTCRPSIRTRS